VVGDGSQRSWLESRARELGIGNRVRFLGWSSDITENLRGASLCVVPSRMEGLPAAPLEAMALGIPVVATAVGGNLDLLSGVGLPSRLVPPEDPAALAAAMRSVLESPAADRRAMGEKLQTWAYAQFAPDRIGRETIALYEESLAGRPGQPVRPGRPGPSKQL